MIMEYAANTRRLQEYVHALEEERRKVQVFQRELPLCMQLVTQAIESCKHLMETEEWSPGRTNCEATSSEGPVLEEFIPLKRSSSSEDEKNEEKSEKSAKKPDWLRSVQLWSQENDSPAKEERRSLVEPKIGGAFQPFCREDKRTAVAAATPAVPAAAASSTADTGGIDGKEGNSTHRKARRCWSPELHRRFLNALQQLGGSHAATPKQIRELMKVDGLTNDEVKSHLQKYRLHTRRPGSTAQQNNNHQPPPQFVVVGGIWVPPPEYTAAAAAGQATGGEATSGPPKEIYAPIASFPPSMKSQVGKQSQRPSTTRPLQYLAGGRGSRDEQSDNANSNSPSTSTSTSTSSHTTTNSPDF